MSQQAGSGSKSRRGPWTRILWGVLAVYWLTLFIGTHLPRVPKALAEQGDKLLHVGAYGGLATLLMVWRLSRGPVSRLRLLRDGLMIAVFAAFDEITQPLVGRFCDPLDWLADIAGAGVGLIVTALIGRRLRLWLRMKCQSPTAGLE